MIRPFRVDRSITASDHTVKANSIGQLGPFPRRFNPRPPGFFERWFDAPDQVAYAQPTAIGPPVMTVPDAFLDIVLAGLAAGRSPLPLPAPGGRQLLDAMAVLGAHVDTARQALIVTGAGNGCLLQPAGTLEFADANDALVIAGLVAPYDMTARIVCASALPGDDVSAFLSAATAMGIQADLADETTIVLAGQASAVPARHDCSGWSSTVMAAIALAALNTPGITRLEGEGPRPTALAGQLDAFGAQCQIDDRGGGWSLAITGQCLMRSARGEGGR